MTLIKKGYSENLDEKIMRLSFGWKNHNDQMPKPIHILDCFREADKDLPGIHHNYELLSEIAHPNWSGTMNLYANINYSEFTVNFGKYPKNQEGLVSIILNSFANALSLFIHSYNEISNLMPEFIKQTEKGLNIS